MSKLTNELEYINGQVQENPSEFIEKCEQRYDNIVASVAKTICDKGERQVVMLAGPSSSGKTTTARKICDECRKNGVHTFVLSLDDFYLDRDSIPLLPDGTRDFETVYALDLDYFSEIANALLRGETVKTPIFDFVTGTRKKDEYNEITLSKKDVVIIEGLHALNPIITDKIQGNIFKIYISISSRIYNKKGKIILNKRNLRFVRRLVRDAKFRGSSADYTYSLWKNVTYGEDKYLFPYRDNADIRINTVHLYEPCVLKKQALKLLESEISDDFAYDVQRLRDALKKFEDINEEAVPTDSLLREFLGVNEI